VRLILGKLHQVCLEDNDRPRLQFFAAKWLTLYFLQVVTIIVRRRKFIAYTWSSIKHESEVQAVARWPDRVC